MLKKIRSIRFVNIAGRGMLRRFSVFIDKMCGIWPVYGIINLKFDGIRFKMFTKGDDNIVHLLYYGKEYHEYKDLRMFLRFAKQSSLILDVGANTGVYSVLSAKVNPGSRICSFEPYPVNVNRLEKNLELNKSTVEVITKAIGNKEATIEFTVPAKEVISDTSSADKSFSERTYEGKLKWKSIEVQQTTLDKFWIESANRRKVDLVKVDVEGYEIEVFAGAVDMIRTCRPVIQCEILLDTTRKDYFEKFLVDFEYSAYLILHDGLVNTRKQMEPNPGSFNYLLFPVADGQDFYAYSNLDKLISLLDQAQQLQQTALK